LARQALEASFDGRRVNVPPDRYLQLPGAVFVTLRQRVDGSLRGCIGSIEARQPLGDAVVDAALGAAFRDPRFDPLTIDELSAVRLDVSVLSPLAPFPVDDEADACSRLERTRPGVVLQYGRRGSVLLPKVWESLPQAEAFLQTLKRKAGLAATFWSASIELAVFTCEEMAEPDDGEALTEAR